MQVIRVKPLSEVKPGERVLVGSAAGNVTTTLVLTVEGGQKINAMQGTAKCDPGAVVLVLGEHFG